MHILKIDSSIRDQASHSKKLTQHLSESLLAAHAGAVLQTRDLGRNPHPALDESALQALITPAAQRTEAQQARVQLDDALIAEMQAADVLVLIQVYAVPVLALIRQRRLLGRATIYEMKEEIL